MRPSRRPPITNKAHDEIPGRDPEFAARLVVRLHDLERRLGPHSPLPGLPRRDLALPDADGVRERLLLEPEVEAEPAKRVFRVHRRYGYIGHAEDASEIRMGERRSPEAPHLASHAVGRHTTGDPAMGARIRAKRRILGLTQVEMARRTGLSQNYLSQVETGSVSLSSEGLRLVAGVLEEDEGYLLRGPAGVAHELEKLTDEFLRSVSENRKEIREIAALSEPELRALADELADFLAARLRHHRR